MFIVQNAKYLKIFNVSSQFVALWTLSKRGAMFDIATHISRSMTILLWYFNLITATAEKPASHRYDVANGTKTRKVYSLQVEIQLEP